MSSCKRDQIDPGLQGCEELEGTWYYDISGFREIITFEDGVYTKFDPSTGGSITNFNYECTANSYRINGLVYTYSISENTLTVVDQNNDIFNMTRGN